jgi:anti-sigma factor ChrR (cupin superfamily)
MTLRIRADFEAAAWVAAEDHQWVASPEPGVERVLLDRIGDEVAVATSIVRYRPLSRFAAHRHDRGEEFFVLDGVFADEHGNYPAGTYVRNPPGTRHTPRSDVGCTLFVKLRQFLPNDLESVVIDTTRIEMQVADGSTRSHLLHRCGAEEVLLVDGGAGAVRSFPAAAVPREVLLLSGEAEAEQHRLIPLGWLRVPAGRPLSLRFVRPGRAFVKTRPVIE